MPVRWEGLPEKKLYIKNNARYIEKQNSSQWTDAFLIHKTAFTGLKLHFKNQMLIIYKCKVMQLYADYAI